MECAICFELINSEAYSTLCGHIFCGCLITANLSFCPFCVQPLTSDKIHKIYLPQVSNRADDNMNDIIVRSLATTVAADQKKTEEKLQEISTALEGLQLTFSKSDSIYEAFKADNMLLIKEVEQLKTKIKVLEDLMEKKNMDQQETGEA